MVKMHRTSGVAGTGASSGGRIYEDPRSITVYGWARRGCCVVAFAGVRSRLRLRSGWKIETRYWRRRRRDFLHRLHWNITANRWPRRQLRLRSGWEIKTWHWRRRRGDFLHRFHWKKHGSDLRVRWNSFVLSDHNLKLFIGFNQNQHIQIFGR